WSTDPDRHLSRSLSGVELEAAKAMPYRVAYQGGMLIGFPCTQPDGHHSNLHNRARPTLSSQPMPFLSGRNC
ncbi:MAG: hypothetical protein ACK56I_01960, partial [bacterium]